MCIVDLTIWQTELGQKRKKEKKLPAKWYSGAVQSAGRGEKDQKNHKDLHQS